jgi:hypothetical protein
MNDKTQDICTDLEWAWVEFELKVKDIIGAVPYPVAEKLWRHYTDANPTTKATLALADTIWDAFRRAPVPPTHYCERHDCDDRACPEDSHPE